MSSKTARVVFFDAADTLVHPVPSFGAVASAVVEQWAPELLPLDMRALARHIETRMVGHRRAGRLVHYPPAAAEEFWRATYLEFLADHLPPARARQVADGLLAAFTDLSNWALFPDVPPVLAALRAAGLPLGILSNWEEWLGDLLVALRVHDVFDHILVSGQIGLEKPDPAIFRRALSEAGVAAQEFVYVGDSLTNDIEPCLALGIRAILIDRAGQYADVERVERLTDLRQLPARLGLASEQWRV